MLSFFADRWHGNIPLKTLFWRDMMLVATGLSLATSAVALGLLGLKMPLALVLGIHFAPAPYNVFLMLAVWRTAERQGGAYAWPAMAVATIWLIVATIV